MEQWNAARKQIITLKLQNVTWKWFLETQMFVIGYGKQLTEDMNRVFNWRQFKPQKTLGIRVIIKPKVNFH